MNFKKLSQALMDYGERIEKARAIIPRKEKLNECIQSSLNKIRISSNNVEKTISKYENKAKY